MASEKEERTEADKVELLSQQLKSLDVSETTTEGKARSYIICSPAWYSLLEKYKRGKNNSF